MPTDERPLIEHAVAATAEGHEVIYVARRIMLAVPHIPMSALEIGNDTYEIGHGTLRLVSDGFDSSEKCRGTRGVLVFQDPGLRNPKHNPYTVAARQWMKERGSR